MLVAQGRTRRARQRALRLVHQPRAAAHRAGRARRGTVPAAAAEAARRRRPGRLPERRQVHADLAHLRGAAEDRRLPVHDAHAEPRRRHAERRSQLRGRRRARADRGRARRPRARRSVPAPHRADEGARPPGRRLGRVGPRSGRGLRHDPSKSCACSIRRWRRSRRSSPPTRSTRSTTRRGSTRLEQHVQEAGPAVLTGSPASPAKASTRCSKPRGGRSSRPRAAAAERRR